MKRVNELLPTAMEALKNSSLILPDGKSILKEYDGYVASFAPSVITAGLKATLSFYTDKHKTPPKRILVLNVLQSIYEKKCGRLSGKDLLDFALDQARTEAEMHQLKKDLIDCAIALKLVMRNFKQVEEKPKPKSENATSTEP